MRQQAQRLEEQEPPTPAPASWAPALTTVEMEGVALAVEALDRFPNDSLQALHWLETQWRFQPDEMERAIRAEALVHVKANAMLDAQRSLLEAA